MNIYVSMDFDTPDIRANPYQSPLRGRVELKIDDLTLVMTHDQALEMSKALADAVQDADVTTNGEPASAFSAGAEPPLEAE